MQRSLLPDLFPSSESESDSKGGDNSFLIDGVFSFVKGVGPAREKQLQEMGIRSWDQFPQQGTVLSPSVDAELRRGIDRLRSLMANKRYPEVAELLPSRERWRLYPHLWENLALLDIETDYQGEITVIGVWSPSDGAQLWVRGYNLGDFAKASLPNTVLTFNGTSFDLPIIERTFPGWRPPPIHLDLLYITRQLGERGGLKAIEERFGLRRPDHLDGVAGDDALALWSEFSARGDQQSLRQLLEYNLWDVLQLRRVADISCQRLSQNAGNLWKPPRPFRSEELIDTVRNCVEMVVGQGQKRQSLGF